MKKVLLTVVFVVALAGFASAQVPQPFSVYAGGLVSLPTSPEGFSDFYKTGFHGSVGLGYKFAPKFQLVGKIEYHTFSLDYDADPTLAAADISGGSNNLWMFGADARYSLGLPAAPLKPFFLGGLGIARISQSEFEGSDPLVTSLNDFQPEATSEFYFNVGAGVELKSGPAWSLFGQVRYVSVATEGESSAFIPITLGVKFF